MKPIKVVIHGASGRMGQEITKAVAQEPELQLVGAVELNASQEYLTLPDGSSKVPFSSNLDYILTTCRPEVLVDFTTAKATMPAARTATQRGVNLVIGTTGLTSENLVEIEQLATANKVGTVVAPNFALGAVLMIHLAKIAGKYFDYVEITELHHHRKVDAPSGTALTTAQAMVATRGKPFLSLSGPAETLACRGQHVDGVTIHSVRLPGLLAHQEVLFGGAGQTLSIRHDTISRECYMPGVIMAIKEVVNRKGLIYSLDKLLGL